jgi:hypothetical protein
MNIAAQNEFQTKVTQIAALLNGRVEIKSEVFCQVWLAEDKAINFYLSQHNGKIEVDGHWPRDNKNEWHAPQPKDRPSVTVSLARDAEAIAKDISRRFIPLYLPLIEREIQRRDSYNIHNDKTAETKAELERIFKGVNSHICVTNVSGDSVTLTITTDLNSVKKILDTIA